MHQTDSPPPTKGPASNATLKRPKHFATLIRRMSASSAAREALMLSVNAAICLSVVEIAYFTIHAGPAPGSWLYIVATLFAGATLFCAFAAATTGLTGALDKRFPWTSHLSHLSAVFAAMPQLFVTAHLLKWFEMNTQLSLAVLAVTLVAITVVIHRFRLADWSLVLISCLSALFCISTLHADFSLSRVSPDKLDLYFIYLHAMPIVSLMLTAFLYLVVRHLKQRTAPLAFALMSLATGVLLLYIVLPRLPINAPELETYLILVFSSAIAFGCTRAQLIRKLKVALPIWLGGLLVSVGLLVFTPQDIGIMWSISNATVASASVVKEMDLFEASFDNTIELFRKQPEYRKGKRAVATANQWNRTHANRDKHRYNVLLITIDAFRHDALGRYRTIEKSYTPNLDRYIKTSTYFKNTYAQGGWTSISLPALIWSKYPRLIKFKPIFEDNKLELHMSRTPPPGRRMKLRFQSPLREPDPNVAKVLGKQRFRTYAITNDAKTTYFNPKLGFSKHFENILYPKTVRKQFKDREMRKMELDEVATNSTIETIEADGKGPFFIWTHLFAPHSRYRPPEGYGVPIDGYEGEVYFADMMVGRILSALKRAGKDKDTVVIITGDHGESFGEHKDSYHGTELYDHAVKVPMIFHMPGQRHAHEVATPVGLIDIAPTILDTIGVPIPNTMHGITLRPVVAKRGRTFDRPPVYLQTWKQRLNGKYAINLTAVVYQDHKLIMDVIKKSFSLFNLKNDPMEMTNLLEKRDHASTELFHRLGGYLQGWRQIRR